MTLQMPQTSTICEAWTFFSPVYQHIFEWFQWVSFFFTTCDHNNFSFSLMPDLYSSCGFLGFGKKEVLHDELRNVCHTNSACETIPDPATFCADGTTYNESTKQCEVCPFNICGTPEGIPGFNVWNSNLNHCSSVKECAHHVGSWLAANGKGARAFMVTQREDGTFFTGNGIGTDPTTFREQDKKTSYGFHYDPTTQRVTSVPWSTTE